MKKSITKANCIKALKKEKLKRESFFHCTYVDSGGEVAYLPTCTVCAVGAILRHMSFEKWARERNISLPSIGYAAVGYLCSPGDYHGINTAEETRGLIKEKEYLAALSVYFESGKSKKQCIEFVRKNFPAILTVEIKKGELL